MSRKAAITVGRPREEVERLWREIGPGDDAAVAFKDALGDRGTEIYLEVERQLPGGKLGEIAETIVSTAPLAKAKDTLRRFKQQVETGEIPRSDASPEGELATRKRDQRPGQPLDDAELAKVGLR